jgi:hypothetical protein
MFRRPELSETTDNLPYDVSSDGTRFLIAVPTSNAVPSTPIVVTLNWTFPTAR